MLESRKSTTFRQGKVCLDCRNVPSFPLFPLHPRNGRETKTRPFRRPATTTSAPTRPEAA